MTDRLDELRTWERELLSQQEEIAHDLEPLLSRRDAIRAKLELVERLIQLELGADDANPPPSTLSRSQSLTSSATDALLQAVELVLTEHGQPMHLREIRAALAQRGVPIPGRGTDANLIVHLRRCDRFERRGRGTYGLVNSTARRNREVA